MATTFQDTPERRQAIWPYLVMPLVVLLAYYVLQRFQDAALSASAQTPAHAAAAESDSPGP